MTTYSAVANSEIAVGAPITNSLMTKLRDNPLAIQEGDASAPVIAYATAAGSATTAGSATSAGSVSGSAVITQTNMASNSVGQSQLKNTYQQISSTTTSGTKTIVAGGGYNFFNAYLWVTNGGGVNGGYDPNTTSAYITNSSPTSVTYLRCALQNTGGPVAYAQNYYVNSSPPYDLGDGDIPLFVFAFVDKTTGDILGTCVSVDPPWAYNGPTNIVPDIYRGGKTYKLQPEVMLDIPDWKAQLKSASTRENILNRLRTDKKVEVEITQKIKNADMNIIPHPFINAPSDSRIVLLDPVGAAVEDLLTFHDAALSDDKVDTPASLLHDGYLKIGNTALNRKTPQRVMPVSVAWK